MSIYLNQVEKEINTPNPISYKEGLRRVRLTNKEKGCIIGELLNSSNNTINFLASHTGISQNKYKILLEEFHLFYRSKVTQKKWLSNRSINEYWWPNVSQFNSHSIDILKYNIDKLPLTNIVRYNIILREYVFYMEHKFNRNILTNYFIYQKLQKRGFDISEQLIGKFVNQLEKCQTNSDCLTFASKCGLRDQGSEPRGSVQTIEEIYGYLFPKIENIKELRNYLRKHSDIDPVYQLKRE